MAGFEANELESREESRARTPRSKEDLVRDFRTRSILAAAERVVKTHGFAGTSLERIAEEAGISKGTIYLYFQSKEDLVVRMIEDAHQRAIAAARDAVARESGASEKLRALIRAAVEFGVSGQDLMKAYMFERHSGRLEAKDPGTERMKELRSEAQGLFEEILQQGVDEGVFRPLDTTRASVFFMELMGGVALQQMWGLVEGTPESLADSVHDLLLRGLNLSSEGAA